MGNFWGSVEIKKNEFSKDMNWDHIVSIKPPKILLENVQKPINKDNKLLIIILLLG